MADLHLLLDGRRIKSQSRKTRQPLQRLLYEALRDAIAQGRLQAGAVLPSSRDLARDLAMARNGVIHAYEQLAAEGYVQPSRQGTVVAAFSAVSAATSHLRKRADEVDVNAVVSQRVRQCDRRRLPEEDLRPFHAWYAGAGCLPLAHLATFV